MDFTDLEKVNNELEGIDLKSKTGKTLGTDYVEVNKRVQAFRRLFPEGCITTEIEHAENGTIIMKAKVFSDYKACTLLATGYAQEKEGSSFINQTSYIENCETSAVGRALGFLGIGIRKSIASKEEVENAKLNQTISQTQEKAIRDVIKNHDISNDKVIDMLQKRNHKKLEELTTSEYMDFYKELTDEK